MTRRFQLGLGIFRRQTPAPSGARETALLERVMQEYWAPLVAYATRLLGDGATAEDLVQRGFVRLWERGHSLPEGAELRPFLYRVVRNLVANEWRRVRNRAHWIEDEALDAPCLLTTDGLLDARELETAVELAVEQLPPRRREIFVLSRYHGLSNAEIASLLDLSPQTVANTMVTALRDLRRLLAVHLESSSSNPTLQIVRRNASSR